MPSPFPKFVAITSSTSRAKYFRPSLTTDRVVKSEAVNVGAENVKLQVQDSSSRAGMIHLKCFDTGKYLSLDGNHDSGYYISARKRNPLSDLRSNDCTLVKYSEHTRDGVRVFHLEFRRNSQWHSIREGGSGMLISGECEGGSFYTNFVIEDWQQLKSAHNRENNIGGSIARIERLTLADK